MSSSQYMFQERRNKSPNHLFDGVARFPPMDEDASEEDEDRSCQRKVLRDTPSDNDKIRIAVNPSWEWCGRLGASWVPAGNLVSVYMFCTFLNISLSILSKKPRGICRSLNKIGADVFEWPLKAVATFRKI